MSNISKLKDLTQLTYDSVEGYRKAYEKAENPAFKSAIERRMNSRSKTYSNLNTALTTRGGESISSVSTGGSIHQTFLKISEAFSDGDDAAAERIEEGEEYLADQFRDALKDHDFADDASLRMLIEETYGEVHEGERFGEMVEKQYS
jgi:uncharacterized protein (TIGR02284 family)